MKPVTTQMPSLFRRSLFAVIGLSLVTGVTFFVLNNWFSVEGEFGLEKHPWQFPVLKTHGASAFLVIMLYGSLLTNHVTAGWRTGRYRTLGLTLAILIGMQVVTAWLLYYMSSESLRVWVVYAHLAVGGSIPIALIAHIRQRIKARARAAHSIPVNA